MALAAPVLAQRLRRCLALADSVFVAQDPLAATALVVSVVIASITAILLVCFACHSFEFSALLVLCYALRVSHLTSCVYILALATCYRLPNLAASPCILPVSHFMLPFSLTNCCCLPTLAASVIAAPAVAIPTITASVLAAPDVTPRGSGCPGRCCSSSTGGSRSRGSCCCRSGSPGPANSSTPVLLSV